MVRPWIRRRDKDRSERLIVRRVFPTHCSDAQLQPEDAQVIIDRAREVGEGQYTGQIRIRRRTLLL